MDSITTKKSKEIKYRSIAAATPAPHTQSGVSLAPPVQRAPNNTGLPDELKEGIEQQSGMSMDDVKVHYNSSKPAELNAHAFAQGSDIHVGAGQEKHLPHEAWHVVQQKQGRVKPTMKLDGIPVNDDISLEREADRMGGQVSQMKSIDKAYTISESQTSSVTIQRSRMPVVQRKVALDTTLSVENIKNARVSDGGALGVVIIPSVVAKLEGDPQAAVDTSNSINALLGGVTDEKWSVTTPRARRAVAAEANAIQHYLYAKDKNKPGSVGAPDRVARIVKEIQENTNNVVIYEQASGKDFIKYLAKGPEKDDEKKSQAKKSNTLKKGRGLEQLATPGYARQLGRIAAIDIFMGNDDRLHVKGNFENWMSDAKSKTITLIDNDMSDKDLATWSGHQDVKSLAKGNFAALSTVLTDEVESLLFHSGYAGGKLNVQEQGIWTNTIRQQFEANMAAGLADGRIHIMSKGWKLALKLKDSHSPHGDTFEEHLDFFHHA